MTYKNRKQLKEELEWAQKCVRGSSDRIDQLSDELSDANITIQMAMKRMGVWDLYYTQDKSATVDSARKRFQEDIRVANRAWSAASAEARLSGKLEPEVTPDTFQFGDRVRLEDGKHVYVVIGEELPPGATVKLMDHDGKTVTVTKDMVVRE